MLTTREVIKTFYNALTHKLKKYRGNWDQNDPTADDYIKNRPFYTEKPKKIVLVDNYTNNNDDCPKCYFIIGQAYQVTWNGTLYENIICKEVEGYRCLGGPGYPFYIDDNGGGGFYVEGEDTFSVSISLLEGKIHKIDEKYLPEQKALLYTPQSLNEDQKSTARLNIDAQSASDLFTGDVQTINIVWDMDLNTETFSYNAFTYYRGSDIIPLYSPETTVISRSNLGSTYTSKPKMGTNCFELGTAIVVTSIDSECSLPLGSFNATKTGTYFPVVGGQYWNRVICQTNVHGILLPTFQSGRKIHVLLNEDGTFFESLLPSSIARKEDISSAINEALASIPNAEEASF